MPGYVEFGKGYNQGVNPSVGLMLDNFDHNKEYWVMLGKATAKTALHFGANDLDGTSLTAANSPAATPLNPAAK